ncbi:hypothetical protein CAEBREN_31712, partial [Caenorhabditis brenneri]
MWLIRNSLLILFLLQLIVNGSWANAIRGSVEGGDLDSTESSTQATTTPFDCGWLASPFNVTENKEVVFQYNGTCCTPKAKDLLDSNGFASTFLVKHSPFTLRGDEEVTQSINRERQAALTSLLYCNQEACPEMEEIWTDCKSTTTSTITSTPSSTSSVGCGPLKESRTLRKVDEEGKISIRYNGECCTAEAMKILDRENIYLLSNIRNDELYDIIVDYLFCIEGACEIKEPWSNCSGSSTTSTASSSAGRSSTTSPVSSSSRTTTTSTSTGTSAETSSQGKSTESTTTSTSSSSTTENETGPAGPDNEGSQDSSATTTTSTPSSTSTLFSDDSTSNGSTDRSPTTRPVSSTSRTVTTSISTGTSTSSSSTTTASTPEDPISDEAVVEQFSTETSTESSTTSSTRPPSTRYSSTEQSTSEPPKDDDDTLP